MNYVFLLFSLIIVFNIGTFFLSLFLNFKFSKRVNVSIISITFFSVLMCALSLNPKITNDLYRHFITINNFRIYGYKYDRLNEVIGAKLFFYLISLLPNNHFLPFFSSMISYGIGVYIILDFYHQKNCSYRTVLLAGLTMLALVDFSSVMSGVRNALGLSFVALGLYKDIFKNNKLYIILLLYLIGISIHPSCAIIVFIILLSKFIGTKITMLVSFTWSYFLSIIGDFLYSANLSYVANKLLDYSEEGIYVSNYFRIITLSVILIVLLVFAIKSSKKVKIAEFKEYKKIYINIIILIIGSSFISNIYISRFSILLGFISIPIFYEREELLKKNKLDFFLYMIPLIVIIGYNCKILLSYIYN